MVQGRPQRGKASRSDMPGKRLSACSCLGMALLLPPSSTAAQPSVNEKNLRPGLAATLRDNGQPKPVELTRIEALLALSLKPGEAPHPRLAAGGSSIRYAGFLRVQRAGDYRFSVHVRGRLRLQVAGRVALDAEEKGAAASQRNGPVTR